jgi:hypothetical protein
MIFPALPLSPAIFFVAFGALFVLVVAPILAFFAAAGGTSSSEKDSHASSSLVTAERCQFRNIRRSTLWGPGPEDQ